MESSNVQHPPKAVVLIVATLAGASAQAQLFGRTWESNIALNQDDLNMIHQTVDQQVHHKPVGTTASWNNPNSKNSGTIKLLHKYRSKNMQCKRIQYTLRTPARNVSPEHYVLNSCLTPEGWRIA